MPSFFQPFFFLKYLQKPNPTRALISYWFKFPERLREGRREKKKGKNRGKWQGFAHNQLKETMDGSNQGSSGDSTTNSNGDSKERIDASLESTQTVALFSRQQKCYCERPINMKMVHTRKNFGRRFMGYENWKASANYSLQFQGFIIHLGDQKIVGFFVCFFRAYSMILFRVYKTELITLRFKILGLSLLEFFKCLQK